MNKMTVERALKALTNIGATQQPGQASSAGNSPQPELRGTDELAACGSPECAGCYDIGQGNRIHPPKIGPDYAGWYKRWEPKSTVQ